MINRLVFHHRFKYATRLNLFYHPQQSFSIMKSKPSPLEVTSLEINICLYKTICILLILWLGRYVEHALNRNYSPCCERFAYRLRDRKRNRNGEKCWRPYRIHCKVYIGWKLFCNWHSLWNRCSGGPNWLCRSGFRCWRKLCFGRCNRTGWNHTHRRLCRQCISIFYRLVLLLLGGGIRWKSI